MLAGIHCRDFVIVICFGLSNLLEDGGITVDTSDSRWSGQGPFPRRGVCKFAFQWFQWL